MKVKKYGKISVSKLTNEVVSATKNGDNKEEFISQTRAGALYRLGRAVAGVEALSRATNTSDPSLGKKMEKALEAGTDAARAKMHLVNAPEKKLEVEKLVVEVKNITKAAAVKSCYLDTRSTLDPDRYNFFRFS